MHFSSLELINLFESQYFILKGKLLDDDLTHTLKKQSLTFTLSLLTRTRMAQGYNSMPIPCPSMDYEHPEEDASSIAGNADDESMKRRSQSASREPNMAPLPPLPSHTDDPEEARVFHKTFGIEIEFLVCCIRPVDPQEVKLLMDKERPGYKGKVDVAVSLICIDKVRQKMVDAFRFAGLPTNDYDLRPQHVDASKWVVESDGSVHGDGEKDAVGDELVFFDGQRVKLTKENFKMLFFAPVEVKSRILPATPESLAEIEAVLRVIAQFPTIVNYTAGFHVHVGQGARGFDLRTLKNLLELGCIGQRQINELHAEDRLSNMYCELPVPTIFEPEDRKQQRMLDIIEGFETVEDLITIAI